MYHWVTAMTQEFVTLIGAHQMQPGYIEQSSCLHTKPNTALRTSACKRLTGRYTTSRSSLPSWPRKKMRASAVAPASTRPPPAAGVTWHKGWVAPHQVTYRCVVGDNNNGGWMDDGLMKYKITCSCSGYMMDGKVKVTCTAAGVMWHRGWVAPPQVRVSS